MKVTTLPEQGKESKGFISSHEIVNKTDLVNRSLVQCCKRTGRKGC